MNYIYFFRRSLFLRTRTIGLLTCLLPLSTVCRAQYNIHFVDTLDKTIEAKADDLDIKGVAAAVLFPDGTIWTKAVGHYGSNELRADMLYEMGSSTKTMVAAIILLLEQENKLSLNDTLYKFMAPIEHVPWGITVKQLLNHSSGLYNYSSHPDFAPEIKNNRTKFWQPDSLLKYFLNPPHFPAGTSWLYNNTNYILLGKVIEAVEGKAFHLVLRDRIFVPQQLNHSYLAAYESYPEEKAGTWLNNGTYSGDPFISFMSAAWAAGGLICPPEDLASWSRQLYSGNVLADSSMDKMIDVIQTAPNEAYGLGMTARIYKGKEYLGHKGSTLQNSFMDYSLTSDFSVVTVCIEQGKDSEPSLIHDAIIDIIEFKLPHVVVGLNEEKRFSALQVYPNPSDHTIRIQLNEAENSLSNTLRIYSPNGQLVKAIKVTSGNGITLNKSELGTGIFYLQLVNEKGISGTEMIIFQ